MKGYCLQMFQIKKHTGIVALISHMASHKRIKINEIQSLLYFQIQTLLSPRKIRNNTHLKTI